MNIAPLYRSVLVIIAEKLVKLATCAIRTLLVVAFYYGTGIAILIF
jgi:hypothetical protein